MKVLEYGDKNKETILIIHGEKYQSWDKRIKMRDWGKRNYFLVLIMEEQDNVESLKEYINTNKIKHIFAICCFHDKWKTVLTVVGNKDFEYDKLIIESPDCIPGKLVEELVDDLY